MNEEELFLHAERFSSPSPSRSPQRRLSPERERSPVKTRGRSPSNCSRSFSRSRSPASFSSDEDEEERDERQYKQMTRKERKAFNERVMDRNLLLQRSLNLTLYTLYTERLKLAHRELENTRIKLNEEHRVSRELELLKKRPRSPSPVLIPPVVQQRRSVTPLAQREQRRDRSPPRPMGRQRSRSPPRATGRQRSRSPPRKNQRLASPVRRNDNGNRERERNDRQPQTGRNNNNNNNNNNTPRESNRRDGAYRKNEQQQQQGVYEPLQIDIRPRNRENKEAEPILTFTIQNTET